MTIIIQHIETYWTKSSRGGSAATARNAVPELYPISSIFDDENSVLITDVRFSEHNHFQKPTVKKLYAINEHQQREKGYQFLQSENELEVILWVHGRPKNLGQLKPNSWIRVICNNRVSIEHTWSYYKHVHNIYFGPSHRVNESFSTQKPLKVENLEVDLK